MLHLLQFSVSDRVTRQRGVSANVTVIVKTLEHRTLVNATPITLFSTTPDRITKGWNPVEGGGVLGQLTEEILAIVGKEENILEVVSVYGNTDDNNNSVIGNTDDNNKDGRHHISEASQFSSLIVGHQQYGHDSLASFHPPSGNAAASVSAVSVWLTVRNKTGGDFMNPVKLKGLLSLHRRQLQKSTRLNVTTEELGNVYFRPEENYNLHDPQSNKPQAIKYKDETTTEAQGDNPFKNTDGDADGIGTTDKMSKMMEIKDFYTTQYRADASGGPSPMASVSSSAIHLQVIDTNNTALVTPRLKHFYDCKTLSMSQPNQEQSCLPGSCLNGGRCVQFSKGKRCICPGGSKGYNCKVLFRSFMGSGWSWLPSIPPCFPSTISLKILTQQKEALVLYSGPIEITGDRLPFMAIQLSDGYPQLVTDSWAGRARLQVDTQVNDGSWHTIHVKLDHKGVSMVIDACGQSWKYQTDDAHCAARAPLIRPDRLVSWIGSGPLQVGGLAHEGDYASYHWGEGPVTQSLNGCVSHITVNGELLDMGEPPLSHGSQPGCIMDEGTCGGEAFGCTSNVMCQGESNLSSCTCKPGLTGSDCQRPTVPATLGPASYYKVALSFTPSHYALTLQIRLKTQGKPNGLLISVADRHAQHSLSVQLHAGKVCLETFTSGKISQTVCIEGFIMGDNNWHLLRAERHGHNLKLAVDDGDGLLQNESFPSLVTDGAQDWMKEIPVSLEVNRNDGVTIGGVPEYAGTKLLTVHNDLQGVCIDDLRISGHQLPIPPGSNSSKWGQVTTHEGLLHGCVLPDICQNISCKVPLTCHPTWPEPTCSCGDGLQTVGNSCKDINECLWSPCLNGGSCHNLRPGYFCQCDGRFLGDNCQFKRWETSDRPFTTQALIATVAISLLVLVLLGLILSIRSLRSQRALQSQAKDTMRNNGSSPATIIVLNGDKPGRGRKRPPAGTDTTDEVEVVVMDDPHLEFMERFRPSREISSSLEREGPKPSTSIESTSSCKSWDQKRISPTLESRQWKEEELAISRAMQITTVSTGSNPD
ncbi:putative neural-cadherin 2 [Palaemon carinicauda]|uniref:putative neural-cadherin 2 n=1 Tax=Palaemon carinicauda TaxID=392227 RepID=UPI0035B58D0C